MIDFIIKILETLFIEEVLVFIPLIFLFYYSFYSIYFKKKIIFNFFLFLFPITFLFYSYSYLPNFFSSLGQDSILELKSDLGETLFYLKTFFLFLFDPEIFKRNRFWLLLLSSSLSAFILLIITIFIFEIKKLDLMKLNKVFNLFLVIAFLVSIFKISNLFMVNYALGKSLKDIEISYKKNIDNYKTLRMKDDSLKIVTYIGESTSALNLGIYGYPFKTTPNLKNKEKNYNFVKFTNTYATHTHSTPSLSDSLSLCMSNKEEDCIGFENLKNNLSVVDVLSKNGLSSYLFSTQGMLGGHNLASKLVLNTKEKFLSSQFENNKSERKFLGNRYVPKIKDKEFFKKHFCNNENFFEENNASIAFLHSYAGHGYFNGYLGYLPKRENFTYPNYINKNNFLGKDTRNFELIKEYDTAIKYIDETLDEIIDCSFNSSKKHQKPLIFIYFADHGESPSTSRGHDSSRLTYEMLHVPLIILFNDEAHKIYKEKFEFLQKIKTKNLTLKFVSDLLLYLFEIDIKNVSDQKIAYHYNELKSLNKNYIMASEDLNGNLSKLQTFFNYKGKLIESELSEEKFSRNDTSINLWQLGNYFKNNQLSDYKKIEKVICQHRANSFIVQYKSSLSNSCFETDIFFKDKVISTHDLKKDTRLFLDDFFKSNYGPGNTLWLDSKNIDSMEACNSAFKWLQKNQSKFVSLIVETPSRAIKNVDDMLWVSCINKIDNIKNIQVAYYLPTEKIEACSKLNNDQIECDNIANDIFNFLKETKINLITFDYVGYDFIKSKKEFSKFKWNIWHINKVSDLAEIMKRDNIGAILLPNDKFFNNLN